MSFFQKLRAYQIAVEAVDNARSRAKASRSGDLRGALMTELIPYADELEAMQIIEELMETPDIVTALRNMGRDLSPSTRKDLHGPKKKGL